ncbi:MAG TPA: hypothetical protein VFE51_12580 [Verrucomicrobiae bacterium]|nr:hypothetical protein [Verrucomicrobiae bacterium]
MKNLSCCIGRKVLLAVSFGLAFALPMFARAQSDAPSTPATAPAELQVRFSPGVRDVLKMLDAKVDVSTVEAYIKNSQTVYNLSANEIIALKRRGAPDEVITLLIQHGAEVRTQIAQAAQAGAPLTPPASASPYAGGYADTGVQEPYPYYADYGYGYPYYAGYPYYGYPYNYWYSYGYPWGFYSSFYSPFYFGYYGHRYHGYYGRGYYGRGYYGGHSFAHGSIGNRGGAWGPVRGGAHGFGGPFTGVRTASFAGRSGSFAMRSGGFSGGHFGGFGGGHAGGFGGGHGGGFGGGHGGGGGHR